MPCLPGRAMWWGRGRLWGSEAVRQAEKRHFALLPACLPAFHLPCLHLLFYLFLSSLSLIILCSNGRNPVIDGGRKEEGIVLLYITWLPHYYWTPLSVYVFCCWGRKEGEEYLQFNGKFTWQKKDIIFCYFWYSLWSDTILLFLLLLIPNYSVYGDI